MRTFFREFFLFGIKQANAVIFGAFLLLMMIITHYWYPLEGILYRYDFLFLSAIAFQAFLLVFKLETWDEALVIIIFHLVALLMEWFKTSDAIASWQYPDEAIFAIGNVPLFTGFMYSAVGSYIARVWRIFDFQYSVYPKKIYTVLLVVAIYINFFSHHYIFDFRWVLLAITVILFWRTRIYFKVEHEHRYMPLILGWLLVALFIWFAENIATYLSVWLYPNQQDGWALVSWSKLSSWYLLMLLSFVLVSLIHPIKYYVKK